MKLNNNLALLITVALIVAAALCLGPVQLDNETFHSTYDIVFYCLRRQ